MDTTESMDTMDTMDTTVTTDNAQPNQPEFLDDALPTQSTPAAADEAFRIIEACLFAAGHPLSLQKLASLCGMTLQQVRTLCEEKQKMYADRGIQLLLLEDCCQLVTKEAYREYIRAALGIRRGGNLSRSSLETVAIIAYHQPVTRSYIDEVRGVDSAYAINSLLDKGLIEAKGRLDAPGRPVLYGTTPTFLMVFGLSSLEQLPPAELFLQNEAPQQLALPIEQVEESSMQTSPPPQPYSDYPNIDNE